MAHLTADFSRLFEALLGCCRIPHRPPLQQRRSKVVKKLPRGPFLFHSLPAQTFRRHVTQSQNIKTIEIQGCWRPVAAFYGSPGYTPRVPLAKRRLMLQDKAVCMPAPGSKDGVRVCVDRGEGGTPAIGPPSYIFRMKRLQGFLPVPCSSVSRREIHRHRWKAATALALPLFVYVGIDVGSIGVVAKAIEGLLAGASSKAGRRWRGIGRSFQIG